MASARVLVVAIALAACGDDGGTPLMPDGAPGADAAADAPSCAAGSFAWTVTFHDNALTGPTLAGVRACVITHPSIDCTETGIDGRWTFCAPANSEMAISYHKAGYMPAIRPYVVGTSQPPHARGRKLVLHTPDCTLWSSGGAACPPSSTDPGGLLWIGARENDVDADAFPGPLGDVSISLDPAAMIGPFYGVGTADPSLTATHAANGNAYAVDVPEGDQQFVTITSGTKQCHGFDYHAWPTETPNKIRVPIRRGFRTFAAVTCE